MKPPSPPPPPHLRGEGVTPSFFRSSRSSSVYARTRLRLLACYKDWDIPISRAKLSTASIRRCRKVPVRWEYKCRGGAVFLTKKRHAIKTDATGGEVLSLRDPSAVI